MLEKPAQKKYPSPQKPYGDEIWAKLKPTLDWLWGRIKLVEPTGFNVDMEAFYDYFTADKPPGIYALKEWQLKKLQRQ